MEKKKRAVFVWLVAITAAIVISTIQIFFPQITQELGQVPLTAVDKAFGNDRVSSAEDVTENTKIAMPAPTEFSIELEWYRSQLDEQSQQLYDTMEAAMMSLRTGVNVPPGFSEEDCYRVYWAVIYDHPEIFWTDRSYHYYYNPDGTVYAFDFDYNCQDKAKIEEDLARYTLMADTVITGARYSYDKASVMRAAYEWVGHACVYEQAQDDQNIKSVFDNHKSVCAGYTQTLQFIALRGGVPVVRIGGHSIKEDGVSDGNHTWLAAVPKSTLAYYDVTWDAQYHSVKMDTYYALSSSAMNKTHEMEDEAAPRFDKDRNDSTAVVECAVRLATGEHLEPTQSYDDVFGGYGMTDAGIESAAAFSAASMGAGYGSITSSLQDKAETLEGSSVRAVAGSVFYGEEIKNAIEPNGQAMFVDTSALPKRCFFML